MHNLKGLNTLLPISVNVKTNKNQNLYELCDCGEWKAAKYHFIFMLKTV